MSRESETHHCNTCGKTFEDYESWGLAGTDSVKCPYCDSHDTFLLTEESECDTVDGLPDYDPEDEEVERVTGDWYEDLT